MSTTPTAAKICTICGQDCSNKPRSKDLQGRYTCKACLEGRRAARQASAPPIPVAKPSAAAAAPAAKPGAAPRPAPKPAAPADDDAAFMAQLLGNSPSPEPCANCGHPMVPGSVLCTGCGLNTQTGETIKTKKVKAAKEKGAKSGRSGTGFLSPMTTGLIGAAILGGLFALGVAVPDAMPVFMLVAVVYAVIAGIFFLIDAFQQSVVSGLCCMFLPIYPLYFLLARTENAYAKVHMTIGVIAMIAVRVMGVMTGAE